MWCEECHGTGEKDCYCGGDLCVCDNFGTYECPACQGLGEIDDDYGDDENPEHWG